MFSYVSKRATENTNEKEIESRVVFTFSSGSIQNGLRAALCKCKPRRITLIQ